MKQQLHCEEIECTSQSESALADAGTLLPAANTALFPNPVVTVGRLVSLDNTSTPLIDYPGNETGKLLPARSLVKLGEANLGSEVALAFEDGDKSRPIIVGLIEAAEMPTSKPGSLTGATIEGDQDSLLLTARDEITLRCGKSSITLKKNGKVTLRGAFLVSRSTRVNHIRGGSVQVN